MKKNGFTLVELMISVTISAMLMAGMIYAFGVEFGLWERMVVEAEKQQIAGMVLTRIIRDVRSASEILPSSSSSSLLLKIGGEHIGYSLDNNKVRRKIGSYSYYLTDAGDLRSLSFSFPASDQVEIDAEDFKVKAFLRNKK